MTLDDRLERLSTTQLFGLGSVAVVLPLVGIAAAPFAGDVLLGLLSASMAVITGLGSRRRGALLSQPLVLAPVALRGDDGLLRVRLWLGRGRAMHAVSLTAKVGEHSVQVGAKGPVIGPWTALLDLPEGAVHVKATCRSSGLSWQIEETITTERGRFAPSVAGAPGSMRWDRSAWSAHRAERPPEDVVAV